MSKSNNFNDSFNHLLEYYNGLLPDNKLCKDYIIIYDYLMDLLDKNQTIAELLVRKKQEVSHLNADILLDIRKVFNFRSFVHEPFVSLTLARLENKRFTHRPHTFCNKNESITSNKITNIIWLTLQKGLSQCGSFVRGYQGDIYEISLCAEDYNKLNIIRINADNQDVNIKITLRILLKYIKNDGTDVINQLAKPYPSNDFNKEWLALVPRLQSSLFEISLPKLEKEMRTNSSKLIAILRLLRFAFEKHKLLYQMDIGILESLAYSEYLNVVRNIKKENNRYDYIIKGLLTRIYYAFKQETSPSFWNDRLNLMKRFKNHNILCSLDKHFNSFYSKFKNLESKKHLTFKDLSDVFDFKMEPYTYEVDQFGIFKAF